MVGILTEKSSAMANFEKALGGNKGTYNGEQYQLVAASGHLFGFVPPSKQVDSGLVDKYHYWKLENLPWNEQDFKWKRTCTSSRNKDILARIKTVLSACDEIAIATDIDPSGEGELIAWEIIDALKLHNKKISRMYFLDESKPSIQKAFVQRKPLSGMLKDSDYIKADYRAKWDFLSMQFTRIAKICGDGKSVLRQGRLKSAMVSIVGDGLKALKNYKKIPFYQNRFKDENGNIFSDPNEPTFPDKSQVHNTYTDSAVVVDSKEMKSTAPPKMLDLAALSSKLSVKGVRAKTVLDVYQKMYEAQIVSYPRTEDKHITPEQFNDMLPLVDKIAKVVGVNPAILTHRTPRKTHVKTGGAHGANRPGPNVPQSLTSLTQYGACAPLIYEILARNYLATLAEDYEYEYQKGHLQKYPSFTGNASVPKKLGYKAVYSDDDDVDADGKGLGTNASPFIYEGFPPKPPTPTMKWLMSMLEKHDVGTGATRASIYAAVTDQSQDYPLLSETRGKISMTQYGEMSYYLLKDTNIGSLKITEQLMSDMRDIALGKLNPDNCLRNVQRLVVEDIGTMKRNGDAMRKELNIVDNVVTKEKASGVWAETGDTISFTREWSGHRFTDDEVTDLLAGKVIIVSGLTSSSGSKYSVRGKLAQQSYNGHDYVGFAVWGVPESWCKHKFTDAEIKKLESGGTVEASDFVSKNGKKFACVVSYKDKGDGTKGIVADFNAVTKIPEVWCQHKFTEDELIMLKTGKSIRVEDCISKKGNVFACTLSYGKKDDGSKGLIPDFNK